MFFPVVLTLTTDILVDGNAFGLCLKRSENLKSLDGTCSEHNDVWKGVNDLCHAEL